jgi:hypothetical protein
MNLQIKNFGPIREATVAFGDLTFVIGPQATGKSLALELFKLREDAPHIISTLRNYNYVLDKSNANKVLDWYFGEGLSALFRQETEICFDGQLFSPNDLLKIMAQQRASEMPQETVFYVPAQRILSISDGRPKNFTEFDLDTPYVLRRFSETLRLFLQGGLGNPDTIFPMRNRLKGGVRKSIESSIFHHGKVIVDKGGMQRKMKLEVNGLTIPFMAWSAGQKEFMPLLLAVYCLSGPPSQVINKADYQWAVIEEPEMGLHPRAILSVMLELIELLQHGYKVVVSTHSSTFLEFVWAFNFLHQLPDAKFRDAMCELFEVAPDSTAASLFDGLQSKCIKTYYSHLDEAGASTFTDVSSLDALSDNQAIAEWGGLNTFSTKASDIVSKYVEL